MSDRYLGGIPVWHEIVTPDGDVSKGFYRALFGWELQSWPTPEGNYDMFAIGEKPVAGIDDQHHPGGETPPFWATYFSCQDVDAAVAANADAGGQTLQEPMDIPEVGRTAALRDPQGALWCPFRPMQDPKLPDASTLQPGDFVWEELLSPDPAAAAKFYAARFGTEVESADMGEMGTYRMLKIGKTHTAGIMAMPPGMEAPPHWLPYVLQVDIDATAAKAVELGGKIFMQPMDIPEVGRIAVLADDRGAVFAIYCPVKS